MNILALETSCDESAAAIVRDGREVLSNVISSQADFHARYGGVIPEMAARQHLEVINYVIEQALRDAGMTLENVDSFAATIGPGLVGALLVGANAAKTLSWMADKPFAGVNHLHAHVASNYLGSDLAPPFICLLVSGGHTQILHVKAYDAVEILGETLDDAVGEAYDKVARLIGLPYPGGPNLDRLAQGGNPARFSLPRARTAKSLDFSFSGLKTAVLRLYEKELPLTDDPGTLRQDVAAAFQQAAASVLAEKTLAAAKALAIPTVAVAGGVSANHALRRKLEAGVSACGPDWRFYCPELIFCTDNAAMVASAAYFNPLTHDLSAEVFSRALAR